MSFDPYDRFLKIWEFTESSLESVRVHSFTLSCTPESIKCDSRASLLARTFASPCFSREPKARVVTICYQNKVLFESSSNIYHVFVLCFVFLCFQSWIRLRLTFLVVFFFVVSLVQFLLLQFFVPMTMLEELLLIC